MADDVAAAHFHFGGDQLIAVEGFLDGGGDAVVGDEFAVHDDVGAGRAGVE